PQQNLADIHEAIRLIGTACGARAAADTLLANLTRRAAAVRRAVAGRPRPRVLLCVGRDTASGQLAGMSIAGAHTYYDEIIRAAGGTNACTDTTVTYPEFSAEGVLQTDPGVIVDLIGMLSTDGRPAAQIAGQWDPLRAVAAVRQRQVYVIAGSHALRPGPRYPQLLEELGRLLHPQAFGQGVSHG
ncbi:MAG: ABC transporter substrate-binding protein, partial [Armatimonadetes bacterium]|nr:ABC transporter substrate-binding protein [Armatimonadota bacterium]